MKLEDFNDMLKELEEWEDMELNPPHVNWGTWAGDIDLDLLLEKTQ